ncbi:MAG: carboxypeptidase regulatory-like domain-containing protein [Gemmatimonadota bacterium]|nr:carboxypeptidase regulatory-like domain-containing protein [Gemmatimonadota bacterium]MDQ8167320.1 carboxypeptidase regulatory-like domain-containing protein [Gemmatimonadota bacterium]MDQ8171112.1 carboxypeptidase regulatory-like domain-containing protein [Gemmatimonadota bacterium]
MRANRLFPGRGAAACALLLLAGCKVMDEPLGGNPSAPSELTAEAVGLSTIRVSWRASSDPAVTGYELQRRADLSGPFETLESSVASSGGSRIVYFDTKVEPNRYYGYQVRALTQLGGRSGLSNVAGSKTSAKPGLNIRTITDVATPDAADPDGFLVVIRGRTDTSTLAIGLNSTRVVSPLAPGPYSIALRGLAANCATRISADTVKTLTITDQGTATVQNADFLVSCRDPQKASIVAAVRVTGDTLDPNGVIITASGIIRAAGTPANERTYFQTRTVTGASGSVRFDNLRPGDYEITIDDVTAPCVLTGERKVALSPKALAVDTIPFALTCRKPVVAEDTLAKPFVLRHRWASATARPGDKIALLTALDLSAQPLQQSGGASASIRLDPAVVRFDSSRTTRGFDVLVANSPERGVFSFGAFTPGTVGPTGNIDIVRSWYTVVGAAGTLATTSTTLSDILTPQGTFLNSKVRVSESTLSITAGGAPNQAPTAAISGPSAAVAGTRVTFSGAGSTDPDGSIASYAWSFGDGGTGTGATAFHTFASAGSFTVRLTVTDNGGLTGTRDLPVTVTSAGASVGVVSGVVTRASGGTPIAGVTLIVTPTGGAALAAVTTNASGAYSISNVPVGGGSIAIGGLPSGCTNPGPQSYAGVAAGGTVTKNVAVTCQTATTGTVTGVVTRAAGGAVIAGATVTLTPTGGAALPAVTTDAQGAYTINNVSVGGGSIAVGALPSGCTNPGVLPYTGVAVGGTVTLNVSVTCQAATTGTVSGVVTRAAGGAAIAGATVTLTPTGGAALAAVTTDATGAYTIANVPVGGGSVAIGVLPVGCTNPGAQSYTGVVAGGTVTRNVSVTCVTLTTGTVSGVVTRAGGSGIAGATLTLTPTGGTALPAVTTNASGAYTISNVPAGGGSIAVGALPADCTNPGAQAYTGLVAGATVARNVSVTCPVATGYPVSLQYGPITNTGPTGRQVKITLVWSVGAIQATGLAVNLGFDGTALTYDRRTFTSNFDFGALNVTGAGTATARIAAAYGAVSPAFETGTFEVVAFTFNIKAGYSGSITPTLAITEATRQGAATPPQNNILTQTSVTPPTAIVIP